MSRGDALCDDVCPLEGIGEQSGGDHLSEWLAIFDCAHVFVREFSAAYQAHRAAPRNEVAQTHGGCP